MTTLTITSKGQVTLRKDLLRYLGVKPGDQVDIDMVPGGAVTIRATQRERTGSLEKFFGMFATNNGPVATLEEINGAAAAGWASAMDYEKDDNS